MISTLNLQFVFGFASLFSILASDCSLHAQKKTRIACVGNSITAGSGTTNRDTDSYPSQLAALLGNAYEVGNFGRSGATLLNKGDLPYRTCEEFRKALDFRPDRVFIKLGTNDSKLINRVHLDEFVADYLSLIRSFRELPSRPTITLLLPVPVYGRDTVGITASVVEKKIIPMIRRLAYDENCEVVNLYNLLLESENLFPDKVHPSTAGAAVIARRVAEHVVQRYDESFELTGAVPADAKPFNFHGFRGYEFTFEGRDAKIVLPKRTAVGRPWNWRARFWGGAPQTDIALLERGLHLVYCDVSEMFANDEALAIWDKFYGRLQSAGLAKKSVMEGMSRGGFYIYRWAAAYPDRVAAIYADAPVLDPRSWPGGKGRGKKERKTWETFKKSFGMETEDEAMNFKGAPINLIDRIVSGGFPMLHVVGDADKIVPPEENTTPFEKRIRAAGGSIHVIHKPDVGHHPHSLSNPQPIADFMMTALRNVDK